MQFVGLLIFSNKLTLPVYFPNFSNFKRFSVHSHIPLRPSSQIGYAPDKSSQTDQIGPRLLKGKHLSMISNFLKAIIWTRTIFLSKQRPHFIFIVYVHTYIIRGYELCAIYWATYLQTMHN